MDVTGFQPDSTLAVEGVWVDLDEKSRVKVAHIGNEQYKALLNKKLRPYRHAIRQNTLPDDVFEMILIDVMSQCVLLGWENLFEGEQEVPYTPANAKRMLQQYPKFRDLITSFAEDVRLFKMEEREGAVKN